MNVIDLFAGAGGLSVGAHLSGASVKASFEIDAHCVATLNANPKYHGEVVKADVSLLTGGDMRKVAGLGTDDPLIVVGGPPCQPFSKAAYWTEKGDDAAYRRARSQGIKVEKPAAPTEVKEDARRGLVGEYLRLITEANADGFVFENVPSIKHPRNKPLYDWFVHSARAAGYEITEFVARSVSFGVAQTRERVTVLGAKKRAPLAPVETHSVTAEDGRQPAVTAREALDGFEGDAFFEPEEVVAGRWAKHLAEVPPGWNYKALTEWAGHPNPAFVAETRFWNFLLKLSPDRPSWTIAASPGPWTGPFHWNDRRLRTPELAALQGFPRDYEIKGSRRERVRQMGNAVPVPMAAALVNSVLEAVG
ncbi:DNA cytosine methyltransferase [Rhizobium leguminosarum bv. viciae]|nr:DNA cytosine methyltransferase [Rhizobium leguminosarum bv. viciae]